MAKPLLTIRCPDDLIQLIQKQEELTGLDRTKVVVGMLEQSLPSVLVSERGKLPAIPAIYLVWLYNKLLYIGRTSNLKQRWTGHHRILHFVNAGENCRISWFQIDADDLSTLPSLEASLIELLEPEHNNTDTTGGSTKYKIQGYVTQEIYDRFKAECSERGLSESQLLKQILSEHFGVTQSASESAANPEIEKRLDELENRFGNLLARTTEFMVSLQQYLAESASESATSSNKNLELEERLVKIESAANSYAESASEPQADLVKAQQSIGKLAKHFNASEIVITASYDESMTLQQVANAIGLNYTNLSDTRKKNPERFLEYLQQKSGKKWEYDSTIGRYGKYRIVAD